MRNLWNGWVAFPWYAKAMVVIAISAVAIGITNDIVKRQGFFGPDPQEQINQRFKEQLGVE